MDGVEECWQAPPKLVQVAGMPREVLVVEEIRCLQEVHMDLRKMRALRMGQGRRGVEHREAGGLEMVHPVRKGIDAMCRLLSLGPWRAHKIESIRQYWLVY